MPTFSYGYDLSDTAAISVRLDTEQGALEVYAVVLVCYVEGEPHTVRVWDNAHGEAHMHRYSKDGGRQPGERVPASTTQEGLNMALDAARNGYEQIIDAWTRS